MDEIQERIASLALGALAKYGLVLAGGQSLQVHGLVDRTSADLDFNDDFDHDIAAHYDVDHQFDDHERHHFDLDDHDAATDHLVIDAATGYHNLDDFHIASDHHVDVERARGHVDGSDDDPSLSAEHSPGRRGGYRPIGTESDVVAFGRDGKADDRGIRVRRLTSRSANRVPGSSEMFPKIRESFVLLDFGVLRGHGISGVVGTVALSIALF